MNELHKQVREDAETELKAMAEALYMRSVEMVGTTAVTAKQLLKLALGGRTTSIFKKAVAILAAEREKELLALYQKKPELKAVGKE